MIGRVIKLWRSARTWIRRALCKHEWVGLHVAPVRVRPSHVDVQFDQEHEVRFEMAQDGEPVARFGVTGSNVISGTGVATSADIGTDFALGTLRLIASFEGGAWVAVVCQRCLQAHRARVREEAR